MTPEEIEAEVNRIIESVEIQALLLDVMQDSGEDVRTTDMHEMATKVIDDVPEELREPLMERLRELVGFSRVAHEQIGVLAAIYDQVMSLEATPEEIMGAQDEHVIEAFMLYVKVQMITDDAWKELNELLETGEPDGVIDVFSMGVLIGTTIGSLWERHRLITLKKQKEERDGNLG